MRTPTYVLAAAFMAMAVGANAQQSPGGEMQTAVDLPEACRTAAQAGGQGELMQQMTSAMSQNQKSMDGMMAKMTETQKGLRGAMMKMDPAMMSGMMAKDADVAWICAMIPHHQGAIDMAGVGLKNGDNPESKKLAEQTIRAQEKEIAELKDWLQKHAKKEGN